MLILNSVPLGHLMVMLIPLIFSAQPSNDPLDPNTDPTIAQVLEGASGSGGGGSGSAGGEDGEGEKKSRWKLVARYVIALGWLLTIIAM
jgi:hypothetical protein